MSRVYTPATATYRRQQRTRQLALLLANPDHPSHGTRSAYDCGCRCVSCRWGRREAGFRCGEYTGARRAA